MEEKSFRFSNFSKYPELVQGISTRHYGDMRFGSQPEKEIINNRQQFFQELGIDAKDVVTPSQVHGAKVTVVNRAMVGGGAQEKDSAIPETDALITSEKKIFLMIKTADCLPVLVYDPVKTRVAAIHAGWRGIIEQIIPRTLDRLLTEGSRAEDLIVGIGPAICQKHFVVKNSVLKHFLQSYPGASMVRNNDGYVDLKKCAIIDLKKGGVIGANIEVCKLCTVCDNGNYGSFRKEGTGAPESASIIGLIR